MGLISITAPYNDQFNCCFDIFTIKSSKHCNLFDIINRVIATKIFERIDK